MKLDSSPSRSAPNRRRGARIALLLLIGSGASLLLPASGTAGNTRKPPPAGEFVCGTSPHRTLDATLRARYRQDLDRRENGRGGGRRRLAAAEPRALAVDNGDVAVIEDDGSIMGTNPFDLTGKAVRFERAGSTAYKVVASSSVYSGSGGTTITLTDDDSRSIPLGFSFPFFGSEYTTAWVNSDGNLTFDALDKASTDRDLARFAAGPPRIGPFFVDLDPPSGRVAFRNESDGIVVFWDNVPIFVENAPPNQFNSFSVKLFRDGTIEFVYGTRMQGTEAVVGIAPGASQGGINGVKYSRDLPTGDLAGTIAEIFASSEQFSEFALTQFFFRTHPDDFDHVIVFLGFPLSLDGAFAYEINVKNDVTGIGLPLEDSSQFYGSRGRLRSFLNMGPLSGPGRYPADPNRIFLGTNSTLGIMGQESGHRWLAFQRFRNGSTNSFALLGRDRAHWSFFFDSDGSVMEGNDIEDRGAERGNQRFATVGATNTYSLLDQYTMGLVGKEQVPDMFVVENTAASGHLADDAPQVGAVFGGNRTNVTIDSIIAANGPRTPAATQAPKVFRQAFILLTRNGQQATPEQIAKVQTIRDAWVAFFNEATGGRGHIVTTLQPTTATTPTDLTFPYFSGNSTRFTGIAVANWGSAPADVLFTAYDNAGAQLAAPSTILNPRMITIPAGQQIAMLGEQIHGLGFGDARNGWISARSTSSQVSGFFLDGDTDLNLLDGAVAGNRTATELYFTRAQLGTGIFLGTFRNLIDVVNPGASSASVELRLIDELGAVRGSVTRTLPPRGRLAEDLGSLFPGGGSPRTRGYVKLTSTAGVVGYQSIDSGTTVFALPAQPASTATRLYSAQFASGAGFFTDCNFINTSSASRTISISLVGNNGQPVTGVQAPAPVNLAPGAQLRMRGETLFNLANPATTAALVQGSLVVAVDGPGVIGDVAFGDPVNERFLASLPLDGSPVSNLVFSQVAQGNPDGGKPYFTGIAMYNPGTSDCTVAINVYSESGAKTGAASLLLPAGNRISRTLPELVPAVTSQARGFIRLTATGGSIVAFELFGDQALEFLAAVPPQPITP